MRGENEPKTVQDYKDVVKILKLKIIKQNKRIQQLQVKNKSYEEQINGVTLKGDDVAISSRAMLQLQNDVANKRENKQLNLSTLSGKVEVMNIYVRGLKKLGISPESVFRIADDSYKNFVESDYFRGVLSKIHLGLSPKQISCLIFIFDESYSGFITRQQYYNSLYAYKLGVEDSYHQYVHQCVFKLSQILHVEKINLIKFYQEMESRAKNKNSAGKKVIDLNVFQEQIKKYYGSKMSQKEIVASFNAIDLQSQGVVEKNNFLYTITSFINKLLTADEVLSNKNTQNQWGNTKSNITRQLPSNSPSKTINNFNSSANVGGQSQLVVPSKNINNQSQIISTQSCVSRLKSQFGVSLSKIYEQLCMCDFTNRMTLKSFKKYCFQVNKKISSELLSQLFKEIDIMYKGSVYFNQLINFYLKSSSDVDMILRLLGRYFSVNDLDSQKFWFMFGLEADSDISKTLFCQLLKKCFDSKQAKLWEGVWYFLAKDRDSYGVGLIIKAFQKYECEVKISE